MIRVGKSLRILRLTQALVSGCVILLVMIFILPSYSVGTDTSSLSVVQTNDSTDAGVSGYNINYVEDHGDDYDPDMEEFVATNEWQQVKHGQAVPRGLHIRMNLQTGVKEAKLLDPSEDSTSKLGKASSTGDRSDEANEELPRMLRMKENLEKAMQDLKDEQKNEENLAYWKEENKEGMMNMGKDTFTKEELKEALKKFKANRDDVQNPVKVKNQYRSINELKKDMDDLNMGIKTDVEILRELVDLYKNETISQTQKLNILTDLEYYVHQIDNALDLVDMGGMKLVLQDLNNTDEEVKRAAAFVIGSAAQSNPKVQTFLLDNGVLTVLIRLLSTQSSISLGNQIMYALSSVLRQFPYAQQQFLKQGGLQALTSVFASKGTEKVKLKAVTLVNDLIVEKKLALTYLNSEDSHEKEKIKQYSQISLLESLSQHGWCNLVSSLIGVSEHDSREKVIIAMTTLSEECKVIFTSHVEKLKHLETVYKDLSEGEITDNDDDRYFTGILISIQKLLGTLHIQRDEL